MPATARTCPCVHPVCTIRTLRWFLWFLSALSATPRYRYRPRCQTGVTGVVDELTRPSKHASFAPELRTCREGMRMTLTANTDLYGVIGLQTLASPPQLIRPANDVDKFSAALV